MATVGALTLEYGGSEGSRRIFSQKNIIWPFWSTRGSQGSPSRDSIDPSDPRGASLGSSWNSLTLLIHVRFSRLKIRFQWPSWSTCASLGSIRFFRARVSPLNMCSRALTNLYMVAPSIQPTTHHDSRWLMNPKFVSQLIIPLGSSSPPRQSKKLGQTSNGINIQFVAAIIPASNQSSWLSVWQFICS